MKNKNMKFVWMVLLVLCASASLALADAAFSVNWNAPLNDTTNTSRTITVGYTPWWNDVETVNCTLDINDEAYMIVNQTPLVNDTLNEITYTYPADGYYKNFISCWNGSTGHSSEITYFYIDTTELTDCAVLDVEGATYYLTADIESSDALVCMEFVDNNITLNCEGHTISGDLIDGETGIYIPSVTGAVVKNCIITDWLIADIMSSGTMAGQIYNNTIEYGAEDGIAIKWPDDLIIHDNFIVYNDYGISIYDGDTGSWIYNNYFSNDFNVWLDSDGANDWNTTNHAGTRIFELGPNIGGNYWSGTGTCTGTVTPCEILNQTDCNNQLGCVWFEDGESYCMNSSPMGPAPCWYFAGGEGGGEVPCNLQLGCSWETGGYSDFCIDANHDGFCDQPLDLWAGGTCTAGVDCSNNTDYLPLSGNYSATPIPPASGTFGGISCTVLELVVIFSTLAIVIILALMAYGGQANPALAMLVVIPMLVVLVIAIMNLVGSVC